MFYKRRIEYAEQRIKTLETRVQFLEKSHSSMLDVVTKMNQSMMNYNEIFTSNHKTVSSLLESVRIVTDRQEQMQKVQIDIQDFLIKQLKED